MTLAEQREKLVEIGAEAIFVAEGNPNTWAEMSDYNKRLYREQFAAALAAISAAGFSIVADGAFEAFDLALVDLARKTKRVGHGEKSASYMPPAYRRSDPDDTYEAGRMEARGDLARKPE